MAEYQRMNEDGLETQVSQAKEQTNVALKAQISSNPSNQSKMVNLKSFQSQFTDKEKELDQCFQKYNDKGNPQTWLRYKSEFLSTCIAYNNGILYYDKDSRKLVQLSSLDKDINKDEYWLYFDQDKVVQERKFDEILFRHNAKKMEDSHEEEQQEEGGEEEAENEAKEGENAEEGAEENAEEGVEENAEEGAEENEHKGEETVTFLASFPELYLVALGSNHGNIYLLNSYNLEYVNSYETGENEVIDIVAGRTDVFSLHKGGSMIKSSFAQNKLNDFEKIKQGECEESLAIKISPNKRWFAFVQFRVKKIPKEDEPNDKNNEYYQLVVLDQGEEKKHHDDDLEYDEEYGSNDDASSDYSGGEDEQKIKEVRYDMKMAEEDILIEKSFQKIKGYEEIEDLPQQQKIRDLFEFYPDSTHIVVRTDLKSVSSFKLSDKVAKVTEVEKICEDKSRVVKMQVLFDCKTLIVMSLGEQGEDLKVVDLEAASKKIRLECNDVREFCASKDGKMIFAIDFDSKDDKSYLKGFDTKTKTLLIAISFNGFAVLMDISNDSNFIRTYNRKTKDHSFLQLSDYYFNLQDKAIMDQDGHFLMQYNKKTSQCELWDLQTDQLLGLYGKAQPQTVCGEYFYIVEDKSGSSVCISRVSSKDKHIQEIKYYEEEHKDLQVTKDNKVIYCLNEDFLIKYDIENGITSELELNPSSYPENYRCFQLSNNEKFIMAVSDNRLFKIETIKFEFDKSQKYAEINWWPKRLDAFHPDDTYMLSRYYIDESVDKWDLKTNKSRDDYIQGHKKDRVEYCCFVSNGKKLITINAKELIYWDVKDGKHSLLEKIEITATPIYGHNKKLTGLQIDGKLYPWSEFLIWELSGNFQKLGFYKEKFEKNSLAFPFYKAILNNLNQIQGPYNRLFPFIFNQFQSLKDDEDPKKLAMIQHMLANVISPQGFTFLGYLTYNNKQAFLKEALKYQPKYLRDINGNFPLTIALKKKSVTTVNQLVEFVAKDQRLVESINHDEICRLIEQSPMTLPKLINNSISKIRGADPLGIDINEDLTDFYTTNNIVPAELHDMLCDKNAQPENKKPVIYKRTSQLLNLIPGSEESVKFHEALSQCEDPEVYQSDFIKYILEYKWQKLKSKTYLPLIVSVFFLLALQVHVFTPGMLLPLYLLVIFLIFFIIEELRKVVSGGFGYISYFNAILILLLPIYIYLTMQAPGSYADYILPVINFAVWGNLINQLKSFTNIRGFMIVLMESVISIKSFLAFFAIMILMFSTSLIIQGKIRRRWQYFKSNPEIEKTYSPELYQGIETEKKSFNDIVDEIFEAIYDVYLKMLGEFGLENVFGLEGEQYNYFDQIAFIILTFIMCVTLLNLVVALMSSAYEEYKEKAVYQQQKELNSVILQVEIKMSSQRKETMQEYLVWMEYLEDNQEKKTELGQMNEMMVENQANWKKLLEQIKSQDDNIDKLTNNLNIVQKEQTSMNSKLDELIKHIKVDKTQPPEEE